jgi:hypothetical protein
VGIDGLSGGERRQDDSLAPPVGSPTTGGAATMEESLHNARQVQAQMIRGRAIRFRRQMIN